MICQIMFIYEQLKHIMGIEKGFTLCLKQGHSKPCFSEFHFSNIKAGLAPFFSPSVVKPIIVVVNMYWVKLAKRVLCEISQTCTV